MNYREPKVQAGDLVRRGPDRGIVRLCKRQDGSTTMKDGRPYLRVEILHGPNCGGWEWPDRWTPMIDHPGANPDGILKGCADCERPFRGRDIWCWTCLLAHEPERKARQAGDPWRDHVHAGAV